MAVLIFVTLFAKTRRKSIENASKNALQHISIRLRMFSNELKSYIFIFLSIFVVYTIFLFVYSVFIGNVLFHVTPLLV